MRYRIYVCEKHSRGREREEVDFIEDPPPECQFCFCEMYAKYIIWVEEKAQANCPKCGSEALVLEENGFVGIFQCQECLYEFFKKIGEK